MSVVAGRGVDGSTVHENDALQQFRLGHGQFQRNVGSPRMSHEHGALNASAFQHRRHVPAHAGEVIPVVRLAAVSVSPLVNRDD